MTLIFQRLDRRLKLLQRRFLPRTRPLGNYTPGEEDYIRTFIVLSHAEIEAYIENLAEYLWEALFEELARFSPAKPMIARHAYDVFNGTQKKIRENHGLKADNVRMLLEPFGIGGHEFESIDPAFLTKLSSFGTLRGQVAHRSSSQQTGLKKSLDSIRIRKQVQDLANLLGSLDSLAECRTKAGLLM